MITIRGALIFYGIIWRTIPTLVIGDHNISLAICEGNQYIQVLKVDLFSLSMWRMLLNGIGWMVNELLSKLHRGKNLWPRQVLPMLLVAAARQIQIQIHTRCIWCQVINLDEGLCKGLLFNCSIDTITECVHLYSCICELNTWEYHCWHPWTTSYSKI